VLRVLTPSFDDGLCEAFFQSLERSEPGSVSRVVIGDNGLSSEFRARWPQALYVPVPKDPFVYSVAINLCAGACGQNDMIQLGDDTEMLTPGWLSRCENLLSRWPAEFGALNLSEPSTLGVYGRHADPAIECPSTFAFFATLIPRRIWNEIGPEDERFRGYGFDDTDYCIRLLHAGYRLGITDAATVFHKGTAGHQMRDGGWEGVQRRAGVSYEAFYEKWKLQRPEVPHIEFFPAADHFRRQACRCANL
jgi:hypothetical protein